MGRISHLIAMTCQAPKIITKQKFGGSFQGF